MSTGPSRMPALRVKLPCEDEKDFYARYADAVAEKGLRVPTANLRPIGSRVRIVLEFRNADSVSGEAVVDAHVEGPKPAMNVRLLKFERARAGAAPAPSRTPASAVAPAPAAKAAPAVPAVPAPAAAPEPPPESSFASIFEDEQAPEPPAPVRPPAEGTEDLEMLYEVPARGAEPEPTPEPRTVPTTAAGPRHAAIPVASRRAALAAVGVGAVLVLGILAYAVARRPAAVPAAPAASAADDAALAGRISAADRRMSEGRLGGPDGALDNLLAAKALRPDDPRVKERLALLADTLETLGGRALDRGDVAEAEVHLAAALQAAPDRPSISAKLEALAKLPQAQEARSRRTPGGGEVPQAR